MNENQLEAEDILPPIDIIEDDPDEDDGEITEKETLEALKKEEEITDKIIVAQRDPSIYADTQPILAESLIHEIAERDHNIYAETQPIPPITELDPATIPKSHSPTVSQSHSLPQIFPKFHETWIDPKEFFKKLKLTLSMIKIQHSIFALPFALSSVFVATDGKPSILSLLMIVLAMVTARNTALTFNRIADRDIDKKNPRTKDREIPSGKLSLKFAYFFWAINSIFFILISSYFNKITLLLSPLALLIIMGYSLTKRITHFTQIFLGIALGISPIAAWIAMTGTVSAFSLFLGLGVLCWVAGFDVIYSTLDHDYDKKNNMKNMVVKWGVQKSLSISKILHLFSMFFLILGGAIQGLQLFYLLGCLLVAALLVYEHSLVKPNDLSRVNVAFFTLNGYVSLIFFVFVLLDVYFQIKLPFV